MEFREIAKNYWLHFACSRHFDSKLGKGRNHGLLKTRTTFRAINHR